MVHSRSQWPKNIGNLKELCYNVKQLPGRIARELHVITNAEDRVGASMQQCKMRTTFSQGSQGNLIILNPVTRHETQCPRVALDPQPQVCTKFSI